MINVSLRFRPLVAIVLCVLAGCASGTAAPDSAVAPTGSDSVARMGVEGDLRPLFLTVYPQPRSADYGDALLRFDDARRVDPGSRDFDAALRAHGLVEDWEGLPSEGFLLLITEDGDRPLVLTAARDTAGLAWLRQALRQLILDGPDGRRVRECRIVDHPGFALRGGSELAEWEGEYRANLSWGSAPERQGAQLAIPVVAPESPLDATPFAIRSMVRRLQSLQKRGAKRFALEFADAEFSLTAETEALYDSYADALNAYTRAALDGLRANDPTARLYLVPQTHWWNDSRMRFFAAALRRSGGLDGRVGLVMMGPEIGSRRIDADGLATARRAFGLTQTGALVYDRSGGAANWGPVTGRDAALRGDADGVISDRGTPVNRLTRLDWSWNPEAYQPEHSWKRAVFELAGPSGFRALADACLAFRKQLARDEAAVAVERFAAQDLDGWEGPVSQAELVRLLRRDLVRLPAQEPKPPSAAK